MTDHAEETTSLLQRLCAGDDEAGERLLALVHGELRGIAQRLMNDQAPGHTLQPTALVNEAWVRLAGRQPEDTWEGRAHFVRVAAQAMRSVLVDHARAKRAVKRGGGARRVAEPLDSWCAAFEERTTDLLALDEALERLAGFDGLAVRVVELRFFCGLSVPEVARSLEVSVTTVERKWRTARTWLRAELDPPAASEA